MAIRAPDGANKVRLLYNLLWGLVSCFNYESVVSGSFEFHWERGDVCLAEYILSRVVCLSMQRWAARPRLRIKRHFNSAFWYFLMHSLVDHVLMLGVVDHCQSWVACDPTFCRSEPSLKDKWFTTWVATRPLLTNHLHNQVSVPSLY